jgi:hypothetical protein
MIQYQLKLPA